MKKALDQVTLDYSGKQIVAALNRSGEEPPMWYVTIGATALTRFPATRSDSEASVRGRVLAWLTDHPDMLDRDQIILGGG
jgi:hypothetical protein